MVGIGGRSLRGEQLSWLQKPIFVSGATGFIGGRVCERLVQAGAKDVRALVHTVQHASRIARLPIKLVQGSLLDLPSLREAMGDAKIVIHCGLAPARGILSSTENTLKAAVEAGVERFIHMSTAAVHGLTPAPGSETESTALPRTGDHYCDNKGRAEGIVKSFHRRGVPTVILRPSIVYGPYSAWSIRLVRELRDGKVTLIDNGSGACNTGYVDNLVDAVFLAIETEKALGETFYITDGERITWGDFIRAHVPMVENAPSLNEISKQEVTDYYRRQPGLIWGSIKQGGELLRSRELRLLLRRIPAMERVQTAVWGWMQAQPEEKRERIRARFSPSESTPVESNGNVSMPEEVTVATQTGTVFFSIEKAKRILGYEPRIPFNRGIAMVEQWLRFANHL
jgi:nucleoside-diphosphate-sugar epimerase